MIYSVYNWLKVGDKSNLTMVVCKHGTQNPPSFRSFMAKGGRTYLRHTADVIFFFYACGEATVQWVCLCLDSYSRNLSRYYNGLDYIDYDFGTFFRDLPTARMEGSPLEGDRKNATESPPNRDEVCHTRSSYRNTLAPSASHRDISSGITRGTAGTDSVGTEENGPHFLRWPEGNKEYQEWKDKEDAKLLRRREEIVRDKEDIAGKLRL